MTINHQIINNHSILPMMLHNQLFQPITTQKIIQLNPDVQMSSLVPRKMAPLIMKMSALVLKKK